MIDVYGTFDDCPVHTSTSEPTTSFGEQDVEDATSIYDSTTAYDEEDAENSTLFESYASGET